MLRAREVMVGGSCPCHPDIGQAVAAHRAVVDQQARILLRPDDAGFDDLLSDGMLALWRALASYDPARGDLESWLVHRVKFRMIDGLRRRSGRGAATRPQPAALIEEHDQTPAPGSDDDVAAAIDALGQADELLVAAAAIDPRLPRVLRLIADGYTRTEAGALIGVSRTRVWQLMSQLNQLTQRASA